MIAPLDPIPPATGALALDTYELTKRFGSFTAMDRVTMHVAPGTVHALLGENGAGKSTLVKCVAGFQRAEEGSILIDGREQDIANPVVARTLGIGMVYQHFTLAPGMTVAENLLLAGGKTPALIDWKAQRAALREFLATTPFQLDLDKKPSELAAGEKQKLELLKQLYLKPRLLILDEPTSVLTPQAVEKLFVVLKKLASEGCSILYISHKLHEIRELCTACTVLRGGKVTGVCNPQEESNASLSRLMIGAEPPQLEHRKQKPGASRLTVRDLRLAREDQFGVDLDGIELEVRAGEVVGIAGVSGNGQKELMYALSGEDCRAAAGSIRMGDKDVSALHPGARRKLGLHFVPEERLGRGAVPTLSLAHNLLLTRTGAISHPGFAGGWIEVKKLEEHAAAIIKAFNVKAGGPRAVAKSLSGGNLQKFIVGREIDAKPTLFIVSQPTWGVDVGAAAQIRGEILALRDAGCAVLVVSEELEELFEVSDRLYVIARGRLSPTIAMADATVEKIGEWMSGLWEQGAPASAKAGVQHAEA